MTETAVAFKYRGREISQEDILYIRALIERHPNESRRTLSTQLCEAWQWRQTNGALRDMVCRGMLLMLDRAGQISLPPVSYVRHNPLANRARPEPAPIDTTPVEDRLRNLQPLEFEQARRTSQEPLFNSLMEEHHYLGYEQPVGEHLKYLVRAQGRPVACLAWSSAPRHLGSRDRYIGWSAEARRRNIRFIAYNTRFLILPWIGVPASGFAHSGPRGGGAVGGLGADIQPSGLFRGDFHRSRSFSRDLLPRSQLGVDGQDDWSRQGIQQLHTESLH